jgi:hypothetical protein
MDQVEEIEKEYIRLYLLLDELITDYVLLTEPVVGVPKFNLSADDLMKRFKEEYAKFTSLHNFVVKNKINISLYITTNQEEK